ncbi:Hypothetical predicted protein [Paramuricea clavata]|uniref:Uncharacterized protein n=1 Tax=Paramuricea clavata TaxID=317549 RepID=A0A6S7IQW6_PARCT|nr:Hypothetical predicted protein [Paramuricea clavata]
MDKTVALKLRKGNYNKTMTLSDEAKHELSWWVSSIESAYNVVSHGQADTTMTTDASKTHTNNTDVTIPSSEDTSSTKEVAITDVPLIGGLLESKGISKEAASIIVQAWRPGTQKQYKYYLQKWEQHCCE